MKRFIVLFAFALAAQAQAQTQTEVLSAPMPGSTSTTEDMALIQNSPAMEAQAIVAPIAAALEAASAPRTRGSARFRAPGEGTTLADISITNVSTVDRMEAYPASWPAGGPVMLENNSNADLYSFRLTHGLTDDSALFIDAGVLKSKVELAGVASQNRQGMRDFEIGYAVRKGGDRSAWLYGASLAGSPESFSKYSSAAGGFSGAGLVKANVTYERNLAKATGGLQFSLQHETGSRNSMFYDGQFRGIGRDVGDLAAYYEFPIAKKIDFGVSGGLASDGNPFGSATNAYHASAYSAIEVMNDMRVTLEAEGTSTAYNSRDSGTTTRFTGVLSKSL